RCTAVWNEDSLLAPNARIPSAAAAAALAGNTAVVLPPGSNSGASSLPSASPSGLAAVRIKWIGVPPCPVHPDEEDAVTRALEPLGCIPVFLPPATQASFYDGYCRDTL